MKENETFLYPTPMRIGNPIIHSVVERYGMEEEDPSSYSLRTYYHLHENEEAGLYNGVPEDYDGINDKTISYEAYEKLVKESIINDNRWAELN